MHRNVARAYDYLKREHYRIRAAHVKILAQKDRHLERRLLRADRDSSRHLEGRTSAVWRAHRTRIDFAWAPKCPNHREAPRTLGTISSRTA